MHQPIEILQVNSTVLELRTALLEEFASNISETNLKLFRLSATPDRNPSPSTPPLDSLKLRFVLLVDKARKRLVGLALVK